MSAPAPPPDRSPNVEADRDTITPGGAETSHLAAALLAGAIFLAGLIVVSLYAGHVAARDIYAFAGSRYTQKARGLLLQREALRHDDLLPLYGSSEVDDGRISPYHARDLFAQAPTGFSAFTVGGVGIPLFTTMENLGALAADLRGKKVAISLSPGMFILDRGPGYSGNFSPLHTLTLMLSPELSQGLKQQVARRMLTYPATLNRNKALGLTVQMVAGNRAWHRPLYYAWLPLAHLQRQLLEVQDGIQVLGHIFTTRPSGAPPRVTKPLDWPALERDATAQFRTQATHNPFGISDMWWTNHLDWVVAQRRSSGDQDFLTHLARSETWIDLEQLLQALDESGAHPLLLTMPFDRAFMEYTGVSAGLLPQFYARLREVAARHHARTAIFEDHETDPDFFYDLWSHISHKGWVHYDRALDAFYHDSLPHDTLR